MTRRNHNGHALEPVEVRCGVCGGPAELVTGAEIYPRRPDLAGKRFYRCPVAACDAFVGCHPDTFEPLGPPAGGETRRARSNAHAHFDALHREVARRTPERGNARRRAYAWLAERLGMPPERCHIGMMDAADAKRVVDVCLPEMRRMGVTPERR